MTPNLPKEFESTDCIFCKGKEQFHYSEKGQFGLPTYVVICKGCGFSFLNPRWNKQRYNHFYTVEYDDYYRPESKTDNPKIDKYASIKIILARFKGHQIDLGNPEHIIDIGSGMGDSLFYLRDNGFSKAKLYSIEPSEFCAQHLRENGIEVISRDVESDWEKEYVGKFDLVIMRHVLEHFLDPLAVMQKMAKILKPNGIIYIAVPNSKKPTRLLKSSFFRVVHTYYFSTISLTNLLTKSSLKSTYMVEGDQYEKFEIYAICQLDSENVQVQIFPEEFEVQKRIYDDHAKKEWYFRLRSAIGKVVFKK